MSNNAKNAARAIVAAIGAAAAAISCQSAASDGWDIYGESKIWAHRVNDTADARARSRTFAGIEVDLMYSAAQDRLFVGHDEADTANNLTFKQFTDALANRDSVRYWLDVKNLTQENAAAVCRHIREALPGAERQAFVESWSARGIRAAGEQGLRTMLWVSNPDWDNEPRGRWKERTDANIALARPDALSSYWQMHPLLQESYPDRDLHLWHTPAAHTPQNEAVTRRLCADPRVRIVLVDYPAPIAY